MAGWRGEVRGMEAGGGRGSGGGGGDGVSRYYLS